MDTYLENTEIHYEMTVQNVGSYYPWNIKIESDEFGIPNPQTDEEAFKMANKMLTVWNDTVQSWQEPRELVNVQRVETKVIDLINQNPEEDSDKCLVDCTSCDKKVNIEIAEEDSGSNYFCPECYEILGPAMKEQYEELVRLGEIEPE